MKQKNRLIATLDVIEPIRKHRLTTQEQQLSRTRQELEKLRENMEKANRAYDEYLLQLPDSKIELANRYRHLLNLHDIEEWKEKEKQLLKEKDRLAEIKQQAHTACQNKQEEIRKEQQRLHRLTVDSEKIVYLRGSADEF